VLSLLQIGGVLVVVVWVMIAVGKVVVVVGYWEDVVVGLEYLGAVGLEQLEVEHLYRKTILIK
jgi:hypothetical protein